MAPPVIHVDDLPEEGIELDVPLDVGWLRDVLEGTGLAPGGPGAASVRLDRDGENVMLTGTFHVDLAGECVACLHDVVLPVGADFRLHLEPVPAAPADAREEVDLTAGELDVDTYEDGRIDLGHWLREQVLLETPVHPRHPGDCPNPIIPPDAGRAREKTIDPRLLPLQKFSKKE